MDKWIDINDIDISALNGSDLAYIGDAYLDLYIRMYLIKKGYRRPNDLHKLAIKYVSTESHNKIIKNIYDKLSDNEVDAFKKGRNYNYHHKAKTSKLSEYLVSSGYEAIIGYLFLKKEYERLEYILSLSIKTIEDEINE